MALIAKIKVYVTAIFQFFKAFYLLLFEFKVILVAFAFQGQPGPFPDIAQYLLKNSAKSFCRL